MKFTNTLKTEELSRKSWRLLDDLTFGDVKVPKGFITDYASIKVFHNLLLFPVYALFATYGNYAATIHDYLYSMGTRSRSECDDIFYKALRAEGVARWRARLMWLGVRIGGKSSYLE